MKATFTFLGVFLFFLLGSCQQEETKNENMLINIDEKSAQLIESDNAFGLDIFREVRSESNKENIMMSPLSISVAMAMAYNGADGETKKEMEETLQVAGLTPDEINASYNMLIKALQSVDKDVILKIANAIFYSDIFNVKPNFIETNTSNYDAEVAGLDFNSPSAVKTINNWVADKTHDKILKIIESLNPLDRMVLLNAIYFNGIWSKKFDENGTKMRYFNKKDGTNIEIPMMYKDDALEYAFNDLFNAIRLPYGTGQYNMVVMLPVNGKNSQNVINELNSENWKKWDESFHMEEHVVVTMPRFKFAFDSELKNVLKNMGMSLAFSPGQADFSKIADEDLYISSVIHKSYIDVNENGTEAAAVTAITFTATSAGPDGPKKIYFTVDKPFVFAITEKDTGAILFIGEVQNPVYDN